MSHVEGESWLKLHLAARDSTAMRFFVRQHGLQGAFESDSEALASSGAANERFCGRLRLVRSEEIAKKAEDTIALCRKNSWRIITPQSKFYPKELMFLPRFPFALFACGNPELLITEHAVSMVGTRSASMSGRTVAFKLAYGLSEAGYTVVSGGALGIDAASHEGAMAGRGHTVAVLGAGLGSSYLRQNAPLREKISRDGLLLTELTPFEAPARYTFSERNRIIAALGKACCVIQSDVHGGSLITARHAQEQKRPVMVPSPDIISSAGCDSLLSQGAFAVRSAADIIRLISPADSAQTYPEAVNADISPDYDIDFTIPGFSDFLIAKERCKSETLPEKRFYAGNRFSDARNKINSRAVSVLSVSPEERPPIGNGALPEKNKHRKGNSGGLFNKENPEIASSEGSVKRVDSRRRDSGKGASLFDNADSGRGIIDANSLSVPEVTPLEKTVLSALSGTPLAVDAIVEITGLQTHEVLSALTFLELRGLADCYYGNLFTLRQN